MKWVEEKQKLVVDSGGTNYFEPDAKSIYLSVFYNEIIPFNDVSCPNIRKDLPILHFSKIAAEPCVTFIQEKNSNIKLSIGVFNGQNFEPIDDVSDQIIINNKWFPIDFDAVLSIKSWLDENSIKLNTPLNLGQLIQLRNAREDVNLIEMSGIKINYSSLEIGMTIDSVDGLNAELYPYQKSGVSFLKLVSEQNLGCILADEMGLGKTLQIIALLQLEKRSKKDVSIVICPATLLENWRRECEFFAPDLNILIHAGSERSGDYRDLFQYDVVILSYDTAINDELLLCEINWNIL